MSNIKGALQRFLSIALSVTTTVWLSGLTLLLPVSPALAVKPADYGLREGDLIRAPSLPAPEGWAVYIINDAGFKRHIFNPAVFNMYGHLKWSNIKDVSANVSQAFTTSDLYKVAGDTKVWSTGADGVKHWVNETPDQFTAAGYNWNQIFTINDTEGAYYTAGSDITTANPAPNPTPNPNPAPNPTPVSTGPLGVSVSPLSAQGGVLAAGTVFNPVLTLRLTSGSVAQTISGLTIIKGGLLANTNVSGISVWQGVNRISNILTSLTSDGKAVFVFGTPLSVAANSFIDLDVKVSISSSATSGTVNFALNSANDIQSSTTETGVFPLWGNTFSIVAAGQLASYTISAPSVGGATASTGSANLDVGTSTQKELAKFQFTESSGKEDLLVKQMTVYLQGSTQVGDLTNWTLYDLAGANLGTGTVTMPYVTFNLATPYRIPSGTNRTFSVKADPVNGSGRNIRVHIQNDYDLLVQGAQTMAYIAPASFADVAPSDGFWIFRSGSVTISVSPNAPTGNVAVGVTDAVLAKFDLRAVGEQVEIRKLNLLMLEAVSTSTQLLTGNVKVQSDDGSQTYLSLSSGTTGIESTTDSTSIRSDLNQYIVIPAGVTKTIKVLGSLKTTATASQTYRPEIGNLYGWRASTKDFADPLDAGASASTLTKGNVLTVQTSALTVASNSSIVGQNVALGGNNVLLGSFTLQAGAAEGLNISGISLQYAGTDATGVAGTTAPGGITNVSVCLVGGTASGPCTGGPQFGTTAGTPSTTDSFSGTLQIPANGTQVVNIRGNVKTGATVANTIIMNVSAVSATGMVTSSSITATSVGGTAISTGASAIVGQTFTYQSGSLTLAKEGAPVSKIVIAGTTGVTLDKVRFSAVNDNLTIQKLRFHTTTNGTTLGGSAYIAKAYLYDGTTNLTPSGITPTPNGASAEMLFSGLNYSLPVGTSKYLSLVADLSPASVITAASSVGTFAVSIKSDSTTDDMQIVGTTGNLGSGTIGASTAETDLVASDNFLFHVTAPVVSVASSPTGSANPQAPQSNQAVFTFTVKSGAANTSIRIPRIRVRASIAGVNGWSGSLGTWDLFDGSQRIASNTSITLTSTTTAGTLTFDDNNQINSGFTTGASTNDTTNGTFGRVADDVIGKTFTVKVDTSSIRSTASATPGSATLSFKVDGLTGYTTSTGTSSDPTYVAGDGTAAATLSEDNWTGGGIFYAYLTPGGANANSLYIGGTGVATGLTTVGDNAFQASDSYPATGTSLTY